MNSIFIPDITNIIISFFDFTSFDEVKTVTSFLSFKKHFKDMRNITNEKYLESIFHLMLGPNKKYSIEMVKNILKVINPANYLNYAIKAAAKNNHIEIVKLLLKDTRVEYDSTEFFKISEEIHERKIQDRENSDDESDEETNSTSSAFSKYVLNADKSERRVLLESLNTHPLFLSLRNKNFEMIKIFFYDPRFSKEGQILTLFVQEVFSKYLESTEIIEFCLKEKKLLFKIDLYCFHFVNESNDKVIRLFFSSKILNPEKYLKSAIITALKRGNVGLLKFLTSHENFTYDICKDMSAKFFFKTNNLSAISETLKYISTTKPFSFYYEPNNFFNLQFAGSFRDIDEVESNSDILILNTLIDHEFSKKKKNIFETVDSWVTGTHRVIIYIMLITNKKLNLTKDQQGYLFEKIVYQIPLITIGNMWKIMNIFPDITKKTADIILTNLLNSLLYITPGTLPYSMIKKILEKKEYYFQLSELKTYLELSDQRGYIEVSLILRKMIENL